MHQRLGLQAWRAASGLPQTWSVRGLLCCSTHGWPGGQPHCRTRRINLPKPCQPVCQGLLSGCSGDVGIGLNIRRMRSQFLSTFTTTYSLRPVGDIGSVFRRYPGMWQARLHPANQQQR